MGGLLNGPIPDPHTGWGVERFWNTRQRLKHQRASVAKMLLGPAKWLKNSKWYTICVIGELMGTNGRAIELAHPRLPRTPNGGVANWRPPIEHIIWGRQAAWSPLWWWPCCNKCFVKDGSLCNDFMPHYKKTAVVDYWFTIAYFVLWWFPFVEL